MNFVPENKGAQDVPYFEDTTSAGGWAGHTTSRSTERLETEIRESLGRLDALVVGFQRGTFPGDKPRSGCVIHYVVQSPRGPIPGRMEIAALPIKTRTSRSGYKQKLEQSYRMALFMLREALDGMWYMQQLAPGYFPLIAWMLVEGNKTVSQMWSASLDTGHLLPPGDDDFVEGEFKETHE